jgi:hypothetical protein
VSPRAGLYAVVTNTSFATGISLSRIVTKVTFQRMVKSIIVYLNKGTTKHLSFHKPLIFMSSFMVLYLYVHCCGLQTCYVKLLKTYYFDDEFLNHKTLTNYRILKCNGYNFLAGYANSLYTKYQTNYSPHIPLIYAQTALKKVNRGSLSHNEMFSPH